MNTDENGRFFEVCPECERPVSLCACDAAAAIRTSERLEANMANAVAGNDAADVDPFGLLEPDGDELDEVSDLDNPWERGGLRW